MSKPEIASAVLPGTPQTVKQTLGEVIFTRNEQRREHRIVIVPAPTFTQPVGVLHRNVGIQAARYRVDAERTQTVNKAVHITPAERRVETATAIEVAVEHVTVHRARMQ